MSLNSADMQNLIPKATEVGRAQEVQDRRSQADLQQAAARFSEQVELHTRHVPDAPKARGAKVERDRHGQNPQGKAAADRRAGERRSRASPAAAAAGPSGPAGGVQGPPEPSPDGLGRRIDVKV